MEKPRPTGDALKQQRPSSDELSKISWPVAQCADQHPRQSGGHDQWDRCPRSEPSALPREVDHRPVHQAQSSVVSQHLFGGT